MGVFPSKAVTSSWVSSLPHARGGVSSDTCSRWMVPESSPRPWGCFYAATGLLMLKEVFPTPVGVFPDLLFEHALLAGLPHARGGVSTAEINRMALRMSSPRPWGCFLRWPQPNSRPVVFPTPVGVFLTREALVAATGRLPHARGGVSTPSS